MKKPVIHHVCALELKNVSILGGSKSSIHNVLIKVEKGEIMGVIGKSQQGQLPLLMACLGSKRINAGRIYLYGNEITRQPLSTRLEEGLTFLLPAKLSAGVFEAGGIGWKKYLPGYWKRERKKWSFLPWQESLQAVRSFKEVRQKYKMYRNDEVVPTCLVAFAPFRYLNPFSALRLQQAFLQLAAKGCGILIIAEETDNLHPLCHRIALLEDGELVGMVEGTKANMDNLETMLGKKMERGEAHD